MWLSATARNNRAKHYRLLQNHPGCCDFHQTPFVEIPTKHHFQRPGGAVLLKDTALTTPAPRRVMGSLVPRHVTFRRDHRFSRRAFRRVSLGLFQRINTLADHWVKAPTPIKLSIGINRIRSHITLLYSQASRDLSGRSISSQVSSFQTTAACRPLVHAT
jgi:hypothetical protein